MHRPANIHININSQHFPRSSVIFEFSPFRRLRHGTWYTRSRRKTKHLSEALTPGAGKICTIIPCTNICGKGFPSQREKLSGPMDIGSVK